MWAGVVNSFVFGRRCSLKLLRYNELGGSRMQTLEDHQLTLTHFSSSAIMTMLLHSVSAPAARTFPSLS